MKAKSKKLLHLEVLRIIAIFFVIFNHTNVNGSLAYTLVPMGSLRWYIYLSISILCKFAVPLFFMISGALLLGKEEPLGTVFKKRVSRAAGLIVIAYGLHFGLNLLSGAPLDILGFLESIYRGSGAEHLWFLYAYLAFTISLPFLRSVAKELNWQKFLMIFVGVALLQFVLPMVNFAIFKQTGALNGELNGMWLLSRIVAFPLIGYYLEHRLSAQDAKMALPLLTAFAVGGIILSVLMTRYTLFFTDYAELFFNSAAIFTATWLYIVAKRLFENRYLPKWLRSLILSMGASVLGVYIIHTVVQVKTGFIAIFLLNHGLGLMISGLLWTLAVLLISYAIIFAFKKVPVIGKLI